MRKEGVEELGMLTQPDLQFSRLQVCSPAFCFHHEYLCYHQYSALKNALSPIVAASFYLFGVSKVLGESTNNCVFLFHQVPHRSAPHISESTAGRGHSMFVVLLTEL